MTLPDYMTAVKATQELDGTRFRGKAILVEIVEHGKHMGQPLSPPPALQPYPATFGMQIQFLCVSLWVSSTCLHDTYSYQMLW